MNLLPHLDTALLIKLASTALLVVVATGFAARFGAFIGAMIAAIPISAGPAYLFIAMENDAAFVAKSALTSLGVNPMTVVLLIVIAGLIERLGILVALIAGVSVWLAGAFAIAWAELSAVQAVALHVIVFSVCIYLSGSLVGDVAGQSAKRGFYDILLRVFAVVSVVGGAVLAGRLIGPAASGVVALIPVVWISMAVVTYARLGAATCSAVLANGIVPMIGFGLALGSIHLLAMPYGSTVALIAGLTISITWTLGLTLLRPYLPLYNNVRRVAG